MRLRFERYISLETYELSRNETTYLSKRSLIKHTCSWRDKLIALWCKWFENWFTYRPRWAWKPFFMMSREIFKITVKILFFGNSSIQKGSRNLLLIYFTQSFLWNGHTELLLTELFCLDHQKYFKNHRKNLDDSHKLPISW